MTPEILLDVAGLVVGILLTLAVLSYMVGDNPIYRLAVHTFVGVIVGYALIATLRAVLFNIILPSLAGPAASIESVVVISLSVFMGILLLSKLFWRSNLGNLSLAYLVGVGAAVALGGALAGTLTPQIVATGRALSGPALARFPGWLLDGLLIVFGVIFTLLSFTFITGKQDESAGIQSAIIEIVRKIGRGFLLIALAVAFAGALTSSLSIFVGRIQYIITGIEKLLKLILGS